MFRSPTHTPGCSQRVGRRAVAPRQRAFTLVELLIVMVIIAILAAILFPVMSAVRDRSRAISCVSGLHAAGTGLLLYIQDYDERYPQSFPSSPDPAADDNPDISDAIGYGSPFDKMAPYLADERLARQALFTCPSDPDPTGATLINSKGVCMYNGHMQRPPGALNSYLMNGFYVYGATLSDVDEPSRSINMGERSSSFCNVLYRPWRGEIDAPTGPADTIDPAAIASNRHRGASTFVYADGHVKLMTFGDTIAPFEGHEEYGEHQPF